MNAHTYLTQARKGQINVPEYLAKALEEAKKVNKTYHYFNYLPEELTPAQTKGALYGLPISVKDCICVKNMPSTAGSTILDGYLPPMNATSIHKLIHAGATILGKTSQDSFGFGSFNINIDDPKKIPCNPIDEKRVCGGSSGGAAGYTRTAKHAHVALGESTGGSIVAPASFCGVVGLCPTYGRVSRYGLIDYANSLDKIGPIGKTIQDVALLLEHISGNDVKDATSAHQKVDEYTKHLDKGLRNTTIGVIKESFGEGVDEEVARHVQDAITVFEQEGAKIKKITLPLTHTYGIPVYYLLSMTEASTNLAKYCGLRYGRAERLQKNYNDYFTAVRSAHFNEEIKRRILLGTFARMAGYRDAYYLKAAQIRTKIIEEYKKTFATCDVLLSPTMPITAPTQQEAQQLTPLQNYMLDQLTVGPNLAGLPHMSIPCGMSKGMPVGMMLIGDHFKEQQILQTGYAYEQGD